MRFHHQLSTITTVVLGLWLGMAQPASVQAPTGRERVHLEDGWRFARSEKNTDGVMYDRRNDNGDVSNPVILKEWILPSGNDFIDDPEKYHRRPDNEPDVDLPYLASDFDDADWETVSVPHDWAIKGPFYESPDNTINGEEGRLPVQGVGLYRLKLDIPAEDQDRQIFLDVDGAMSYASVWLNGKVVGGWPYGYNSFRLDLTPFIDTGAENQLVIRVDNPPTSARWYPGAGLYRNVWLTKTAKTHISQWGTWVSTRDVSPEAATVDLQVTVENHDSKSSEVEVVTAIHVFDPETKDVGEEIVQFPKTLRTIELNNKTVIEGTVKVSQPRLWGPLPQQTPNLYVAVTKVYSHDGKELDVYQTEFGIRKLEYKSDGLFINEERIPVRGVNQHHDLGALGSAFNLRAAERQLELLREIGTNAIRTAHNPPAPELLQLTDRMGFIVLDEIFDCWRRQKLPNDFHLIFDDWHEQDVRSLVRRDRNHASVIAWSYGNEVPEQSEPSEAGQVSQMLHDIMSSEDPLRPLTMGNNFARPENSGAALVEDSDVISLNYQGAGVGDTVNFEGTWAYRWEPSFPVFREAYPDKMIWTSEASATFSTRGTYFFPVVGNTGAPVNDSSGGNSELAQVSSYDLYAGAFGASVDRGFEADDRNPYVAGEFVWSGTDYLGESQPYPQARSSYFGILDLAGFKKDRFYLYHSRWQPDVPLAHILPHWNWPDRENKTTPVQVYTSGDEAELFLNDLSLGRKQKGEYEYRLRWDDVQYTPGELHVVAYKNNDKWAEDIVRTTGEAKSLQLSVDRSSISGDGKDLAFITAEILDSNGDVVPMADNLIKFSSNGPGKIVATDNGNQYDFTPFPSSERKALSGLALAIVRSEKGGNGQVEIVAEAEGLTKASITVQIG